MKVLFNHALPFALAHGGFQIQIEQTKQGLEALGVEVEFVRWWDDEQTGDLIHHFTAPSFAYLQMAREKGIPSVITHLFTETCNRSPQHLRTQGLFTRLLLRLPSGIKNQLNWKSFRQAERMIVGLEAEKRVLEVVFGLPASRVDIIPLGLNDDFLKVGKPSRSESYLISTGTITERKRNIELAKMAKQAQVPVLFVGKPYSAGDSYAKEFARLVDNRFVFHRNHVSSRAEMIGLLQGSRGFVIYSRYENWCLSAHEAAACGLPVLVPDQPWSRECFGSQASYLHAESSPQNPARLRSFYHTCLQAPSPVMKFYSWREVGERTLACYRALLNR